ARARLDRVRGPRSIESAGAREQSVNMCGDVLQERADHALHVLQPADSLNALERAYVQNGGIAGDRAYVHVHAHLSDDRSQAKPRGSAASSTRSAPLPAAPAAPSTAALLRRPLLGAPPRPSP